jgi:HKD family nuclease
MIKPLLYERQLVTRIERELVSAREFKIATAMVSRAGVEWLSKSLAQCLDKGGKGKILIGVDLPSDPNAIEMLDDAATEYSKRLKLKYFRPLKNRIFHPKLFLFTRSNGKVSAIVGSSNLTGGGLAENYEANVLVQSESVTNELTEYFDEHFEGAYSSDVTSEWIAEYRKEWAKRKKLIERLRKLRQKTQVAARKKSRNLHLPKRIKGYHIAFTGGIPDWPRTKKLYPLVKKLGGHIVEAEHISNANYLIHAEMMNGRKSTRKLRGAHHFRIPIITEEEFWSLISKEKSLRKKGEAS